MSTFHAAWMLLALVSLIVGWGITLVEKRTLQQRISLAWLSMINDLPGHTPERQALMAYVFSGEIDPIVAGMIEKSRRIEEKRRREGL